MYKSKISENADLKEWLNNPTLHLGFSPSSLTDTFYNSLRNLEYVFCQTEQEGQFEIKNMLVIFNMSCDY